ETVTEMITHQKPTDPEKPTDPKDPEDPNKPEEPKDPEDPEKPTDPNNPDPEDPTDPPVKFGTGGRKFVKTDAQSGNTLQGAEFIVKQGNNFAIFTTNATTGEYVFAEWTTDKAKGTKIDIWRVGQTEYTRTRRYDLLRKGDISFKSLLKTA
ncbi:hypothetical protein NOM68_18585, partial [Proteus mirabilis]|nr:hypothetical protein [Proteus mirabilis]